MASFSDTANQDNHSASPRNYPVPPSTPNFGDRYKGHAEIELYTWGRGDLGQLGQGKENNVSVPSVITTLKDSQLIHLAGNLYHSASVTLEGSIYMVGCNDNGQLGCKGRNSQFEPVRLDSLDSHKVISIACGQQHTVAVTHTGVLASWGAAEFGQLGQGKDVGVDVLHPRIVKAPHGVRFVQVACGDAHTLALTCNGRIFSCGQGTFGALGLGSSENAYIPTIVDSLWSFGIVQISCGDNHSVALDIHGRVFTWGRGKFGQLGLGNQMTRDLPNMVSSFSGHRVQQIAAGGDHTLALTESRELYAWGRGHRGQLGSGRTEDEYSPRRVLGMLSKKKGVQISCGTYHSIALTTDGQTYAWGGNDCGQLGLQHTNDCLVRVQIRHFNIMATFFVYPSSSRSLINCDILNFVVGNSLAAIQNPLLKMTMSSTISLMVIVCQ